MVQEDRLRYSIPPAPGLWMYRKGQWVGETGNPVRSPSFRSTPVALWLSAVWTDLDSSKFRKASNVDKCAPLFMLSMFGVFYIPLVILLYIRYCY